MYAAEWEGMIAYEQGDCTYSSDIWTSPQNVQFGKIPSGEEGHSGIIVENGGNLPLEIDKISSANAAITVDPDQLTLKPGESKVLTVTYASKGTAIETKLNFDSNDIDDSRYAIKVLGNLSGSNVGDDLPSFNLQDADGNVWDSKQFSGITVLAYFATY